MHTIGITEVEVGKASIYKEIYRACFITRKGLGNVGVYIGLDMASVFGMTREEMLTKIMSNYARSSFDKFFEYEQSEIDPRWWELYSKTYNMGTALAVIILKMCIDHYIAGKEFHWE
jgi:hypothetical protein